MIKITEREKDAIGLFCHTIGGFIKQQHPRIQGFVINMNNSNLTIGSSTGGYNPDYYPQPGNFDDSYIRMNTYIQQNENIIKDIMIAINREHPLLKTFNVFYKIKTRKVNICRSRIGALSIPRSRLMDEFQYNHQI